MYELRIFLVTQYSLVDAYEMKRHQFLHSEQHWKKNIFSVGRDWLLCLVYFVDYSNACAQSSWENT